MSAPASNVICGQIRGTGAQLDVKTIGFRPKAVLLNVGGISGQWSKSMADASAYKRLANGTGSLVSVNGITPLADGFRLGADADLNAAATVIDYIVFAE